MKPPVEIANETWNVFLESVAKTNGLEVWKPGDETGIMAFAMFANAEGGPPRVIGNIPPEVVESLMQFHLAHMDNVEIRLEQARGPG